MRVPRSQSTRFNLSGSFSDSKDDGIRPSTERESMTEGIAGFRSPAQSVASAESRTKPARGVSYEAP